MTRPEDRMAFLRAIDRVEPQVFKELYALGPTATPEDIAGWLDHWHLEGAGLDPVEMLTEARSGLAGIPAVADWFPLHCKTITLCWEPGDTGERRSEFEARAKRIVKEYADRVEAWAAERGIAPRPRELATGEAEAGVPRWDLLASRLVLQQTYEKIGAPLGISKEGARKLVRSLADRLGISLT